MRSGVLVDGQTQYPFIAGSHTTCQVVDLVASAVSNLKNSHSISLFPQPATDYLSVKVSGELPLQGVMMELINPLGVVKLGHMLGSPDFTTGVRIDLSGLESGFYFLRIRTDEYFWTQQFWGVKI
jgi:hypothetical protein